MQPRALWFNEPYTVVWPIKLFHRCYTSHVNDSVQLQLTTYSRFLRKTAIFRGKLHLFSPKSTDTHQRARVQRLFILLTNARTTDSSKHVVSLYTMSTNNNHRQQNTSQLGYVMQSTNKWQESNSQHWSVSLHCTVALLVASQTNTRGRLSPSGASHCAL